jgi:ABC-type transport system involved in multi-copper enzyme maturation permease subunit
MMAALKSELRKIYTVRSTYAVLLFSFVLMMIFAFWIEGVKAGSNGAPTTDSHKLATLLLDAITNLAFWGGIVGMLSATHEYRYNTIMYTLTSSRSRSQTLIAKIVSVSIFAVLFAVFVTIFAGALMYLGLAIKGLSLSHQVIPLDIIWRILFVSWGYSMVGLLLGVAIRHQIGTFVAFFVLPSAFESLAGLLLKDNRIYLPFTALQQVTHLEGGNPGLHLLSHGRAALVFGAYLAIGWLIAWLLFLRRDAA